MRVYQFSDGKDIVFLWVPSHTGIWGNDIVDQTTRPQNIILSLPVCSLPWPTTQVSFVLWPAVAVQLVRTSQQQAVSVLYPDLLDPPPRHAANRKEETVLSRLHIGHIHVTHSFLLKQEEPPWCYFCDAPFTVSHFLTECSDLIETKNKYVEATDLKTIFKETDSNKVLGFFKRLTYLERSSLFIYFNASWNSWGTPQVKRSKKFAWDFALFSKVW